MVFEGVGDEMVNEVRVGTANGGKCFWERTFAGEAGERIGLEKIDAIAGDDEIGAGVLRQLERFMRESGDSFDLFLFFARKTAWTNLLRHAVVLDVIIEK